jgi:hypothetical protein
MNHKQILEANIYTKTIQDKVNYWDNNYSVSEHDIHGAVKTCIYVYLYLIHNIINIKRVIKYSYKR